LAGCGFRGAVLRTHFMMYGHNPAVDAPVACVRSQNRIRSAERRYVTASGDNIGSAGPSGWTAGTDFRRHPRKRFGRTPHAAREESPLRADAATEGEAGMRDLRTPVVAPQHPPREQGLSLLPVPGDGWWPATLRIPGVGGLAGGCGRRFVWLRSEKGKLRTTTSPFTNWPRLHPPPERANPWPARIAPP
jgi:hypothetical protein